MNPREELAALRRLAELEAKASGAAASQVSDPEKEPVFAEKLGRGVLNTAAGAIRGAGSIGATILAPFDVASDALAGKGLSLASNRKRRSDMDAALAGLGADTGSLAYGAGKLGSEIAGTLGTGGLLAGAAARLPMASRAVPLLDALRTSGMTAGRVTGAKGVAARIAGGGAAGGASAALVNPDDAATGAVLGAALPSALQSAGRLGSSVGQMLRGPVQAPDLAGAVQAARAMGYVIPPTQARPTIGNRLIEGLAGKLTTAQNASAKNQAVTNRLAAEAIGLPPDTKITHEALVSVRNAAGQAYDSLGKAGVIAPGQEYSRALDKIAEQHIKAAAGFPDAKASPVIDLVDSLRSQRFDASAAIAKVKELRSAADDAFRNGATDVGRASKAAASAIEDAIEAHLDKTGAADALESFRDARKLIAKTYTVEKVLNKATGTVDAKKLAAQLNAGRPLSGGLRHAAEFAARFPKAAQATEGMGSLPQTSPLDWALGGTLSAATSNPLMMLAMGARPAARALSLSAPVQNRLLQQPQSNELSRLLADPRIQAALLRSSPAIAAD